MGSPRSSEYSHRVSTDPDRDSPGQVTVGRPSVRSREWFAAPGRHGFIYRAWLRSEGFTPEVFDGRPVVGILNSFSEATPCNAHLRGVAAAVARGVWQAGGFPLEIPTMSLGETLVRPTAMLYRNLMAMEVEEVLRANPLDAAVLLSGCDKTTPAMLMGAASVDLPSILVTGGPALRGRFRGEDLGSGTDVWRLSEARRAGQLSEADYLEAESCMQRSTGHCMTMGTASTMACLTEALGMSLPGAAAVPAVDSARLRIAQASGQRAVALAAEGRRPSSVLTRRAFENALRTLAAIGGSTNAVLHLLALAGRAEVALDLDDVDRLGADVPVVVDLQPSGRFLMEDFYDAGGLPVVLAELLEAGLLDGTTVGVTGRPLSELVSGCASVRPEVIRPLANPLRPAGDGIVVVRGSLAPDGAIVKVAAATPTLLRHEGRAVVFDSIEEYLAAADREDVDIAADDVLVLRFAGPKGYPGMPEVGNLPLPRRLLAKGVTDMVRVSDARMSGTAYGTVVLHVAPEAAAGGPLALVASGDRVRLDVPGRRLELLVDPATLAARRAAWSPPASSTGRGWVALYRDHVLQADRGCDLDFLVGRSGDAVPRHNH